MKKLLAALSAAVISAGALVSCGSSGSSSSKDAQPAAVGTTAPDYSSGDASLIVGKWYMSPETAEQLKTESDLDVLTTSYIEFFADGSVNVFEEANMSSNLFLTDDIISLNGDETEYTFDGKDITVPTGESTVLFKRADSDTSSELYGTYTCEALFGSTDVNICFIESGVTLLRMENLTTFIYDPSAKTLILDDGSGTADTASATNVELTDSQLILTDNDGTSGIYVKDAPDPIDYSSLK